MPKSATKSARKAQPARGDGHRFRETSAEGVEATQAREAGAKFDWHYGRVSRLGNFQIAGGREVVIVWEEGGVSSQQGKSATRVGDPQAGVHDHGPDRHPERRTERGWRSDFRFLEAVRGAYVLPDEAVDTVSSQRAPLCTPPASLAPSSNSHPRWTEGRSTSSALSGKNQLCAGSVSVNR